MQSNKLRMAIRATAAMAALGIAGQVSAVELNTGEYKTNLYGFARVAASYDIDEDLASGGQSANFSNITGGSNTSDGHFGMDANTSRVGLSVVAPSGMKAVVEYDFDRDDSLTPRLRHAYGEYNGVLIGQNWSNYNSFVGNTSSLDFDGVPGLAGTQGRAVQVRYTTGALSFSIEEPANTVVNGSDTDGDPDTSSTRDGTPAFTARLEDSEGGLSYSAAVMAKQLTYDTGSDDDSVIGYAAFLAAKFAVTDMISVQGAVNYGDGAGGYVWRAGGNFGQPDGYLDGNDVETNEAWGAALGASMNLGGGRSVNLGYGTASVDLDDAVDAGQATAATTDTNTMVFLNYQWSPVEKVNMGVEYAYLETETQGGADGDANRLLFLAQYSF
ncbi:MAG: hypothetical protein HLUCCX14_09830 [Marinobacter excellens HL-55]|uniref:Porin n=1 Tax=Marinobacter excellens HL-55 TaxID=1305731 RepID=A0A0P7ZGZ4_9GAMM|nr:MAG: hypothetical protein HLUCCX14_09830 [Marinobacter excellens HL-55]